MAKVVASEVITFLNPTHATVRHRRVSFSKTDYYQQLETVILILWDALSVIHTAVC